MNNDKVEGEKRNTHLFQHLVAMFQTLALQQLGKLINPITGKLERDLQQARITIDMIQMIKGKTAGNLSSDEQRLVDTVVLELQMNFIDELQHGEEPSAQEEDAQQPEGQAEAPVAGATEMRTDEQEATETKAKKRSRAKKTSKKSVKKRKKKKTT